MAKKNKMVCNECGGPIFNRSIVAETNEWDPVHKVWDLIDIEREGIDTYYCDGCNKIFDEAFIKVLEAK